METNQSTQNSKNLWTFCTQNQHLISDELEKSLDPVSTGKSLLMQIFWELEQEVDDCCESDMSATKLSRNSHQFKQWIDESVGGETQGKEINEMSALFQNTNKRMLENQTEIDNIRKTILELSGGHQGLMEMSKNSGFQNPDGFMYKDVKDFKEKTGTRCLAKCNNCGSTNTKQISLISHSCSFDALQQLFSLRLTDMKGKKLLDIGSGMGSILYAAYCLTDAAQITGIELNQRFCEMVSKVITSYGMNRIQVIHGDLRDHAKLIQDSDVITFNNSFEYFVPKDVQICLWQFIKNNMKSGSIFVTNPSLHDLFSPLQPELGIKIEDWVSKFIFPPDEMYEKSIALAVIQKPDENFCIYKVI